MNEDRVGDELIDAVDADDRVIGRYTRREIHRRELRHRACHALVFNAAGELFLQHRSMRKDNNPGRWDSSCAGHVDSGESYDACIVRELEEELGIRLDAVPQQLFRIAASAATEWEFSQIYRVDYDGPLQLDPEEVAGGRWLTPAQVDAWLAAQPESLTPGFRQIWARYRAAC